MSDHDVRSFRRGGDKLVQAVPDSDFADLDAEFWRDVAREERRMVFRCRECFGVNAHHPSCPSADDGPDDEMDDECGDEP